MDLLKIIYLIGFTIDVIGKILIAYTALAVHTRFRHEHKVDEAVFKTMRNEYIWAILGIVLIIIGYFFQLPYKLI